MLVTFWVTEHKGTGIAKNTAVIHQSGTLFL
jgi:hypothetical protein